MKKKVILTTLLSLVLLLAAVGAGLNAVFSITSVKVDYSTRSEESKAEALSMQRELDAFVGKSTVSLDLNEVRAVVNRYSYFQLVSLEKQYPQVIAVKVEERREVFAVESDGDYRMFDSEGKYLATRRENENRADGAENVLLENIEEGGEYFSLAISAAAGMDAHLPNVRMNVVSIRLETPGSGQLEAHNYFLFTMREGVQIRIYEPTKNVTEKVKLVAEKYLSLVDEEKMFGEIRVQENTNKGTLNVSYIPRDQM